MRRLALLLSVVLGMPLPAQADSAGAFPAGADKHLIDLAFRTCLAYPDNLQRLKVRLDATLTMAEQKTESFFLGRNPGKVWLDRGPNGNFAVVILDNGRCAVEGDTPAIDGVMDDFAAAARSVKPSLVQSSDDLKGSFRGAPGHTRVYSWTRDDRTYRVTLEGTPLAAALLHAEIALEPAP